MFAPLGDALPAGSMCPPYFINGVTALIADYSLCDTCSTVTPPGACGLCFMCTQASPIPSDGATWTWNGTSVAGCSPYVPHGYTFATCTSTCDGAHGVTG
jgi:hypothetical protein